MTTGYAGFENFLQQDGVVLQSPQLEEDFPAWLVVLLGILVLVLVILVLLALGAI